MIVRKPEELPPTRGPESGKRLLELLTVLDKLRSPDGCAWDREQTPRSLIPYLLEETYEVIESIERGDQEELKEELGDLLLHVLFQVKLAEEREQFTLEECLTAQAEKLIQRHPNVFGGAQVDGKSPVNQNWETAKRREKRRVSRLDGVPRKLPSLTRARRIQEKAAQVGFDWSHVEPVWDKVREELQELQAAHQANDIDALEDELGDVLFSLVNLGRFFGVSAEDALRRTIAKFEYRFRKIEEELKRQNKTPEEATLEDMDAIWNRYRNKH